MGQGSESSGMTLCDAQEMGRSAPRTPQPLAAADVVDMNMLNSLMLGLVTALAQAGVAFPRAETLQNCPTMLVFWISSFNHRSSPEYTKDD